MTRSEVVEIVDLDQSLLALAPAAPQTVVIPSSVGHPSMQILLIAVSSSDCWLLHVNQQDCGNVGLTSTREIWYPSAGKD